ncbi:unnamed protein product [Vitrella brassicaformis CCMP3155]|uniref:Conserved oligomeric Golgi complex subunit 6 n=2 Tax=Vitrella brassicaformis TaxID=1169539 RepID=A0A0G4GXQ0_VITBC|nr:unnamed protein product [Vitrella brassicaformis CCMP3155]|mmetsp:Transcript_3290/g.8303  ORF Transcript_3290/g.8303 Transcript_3290/m.8303 type:complete len:731 (+) Transcript_3290:3-2195(+)|eukprot:CEM35876.1 unnamed protein product [Vitrella brassicaformis CCMP3155]
MSGGSSSSSSSSNKLAKLASTLSDHNAAIDALASFGGLAENTSRSRKGLRHDIEAKSVRLHRSFLEEFAKVECAVRGIEAVVNTLQAACDKSADELRHSRLKTEATLEQANRLREQRATLQHKQKLLDTFLIKFKLSDQQMETITNTDLPIDSHFFAALHSLEAIRDNARVLLASSRQHTAGVDVLHETSEILEVAYERLFVWVQQKYRLMGAMSGLQDDTAGHDASPLRSMPDIDNHRDESPEGRRATANQAHPVDQAHESVVLRKALRILRERPVYFNHCARDIAKVRRHVLIQRFHTALSKGGPGRPIEMHAYDPVRYVGDMLAWIHQSAASEIQEVSSFFQMSDTTDDTTDQPHTEDKTADERSGLSHPLPSIDINAILDTVFEGLVNPFSIRVEQVLSSRPSAVALYKVSQLLDFFAKTLEPLMMIHPPSDTTDHKDDGATAAIDHQPAGGAVNGKVKHEGGTTGPTHVPVFVRVCQELQANAFECFMAQWEAQALRLHELPSSATYTSSSSGFSAPAFVVDTVGTLCEIMCVYEASLVEKCAREVEFAPILDASLNPILNFCRTLASHMPDGGAAVFLINSYSYMQLPLTKHDFTVRWVELFATLIEEQMNVLIRVQTEEVLDKIGFAERLTDLRNKAPDAPLESVPSLHPISLSSCLRSFYTSLFTMGSFVLPLVEKISSRGLRSEARQGVSRRIADAYEELYRGVESLGICAHKPEEISLLL